MNKIFLISTLLFSIWFAAGANSLRIMPDLRKLDWQADEFSRCEFRDGIPVWVVEVPPEKAKGTHGLKAAFDITPYRGKQVTFMIRFKATGVTEPQKKYLGSKFMLHFRPAPGEVPRWLDANLPQGTTDWQTGAFTVNFPAEATDGLLRLGLQDVSGKIEFEFIAPVNSKAEAAIKRNRQEFSDWEARFYASDPRRSASAKNWSDPAYDDSGWREITGPANSFPDGIDGVGWYRYAAVLPAEWAGRELTLSMGAIDDADETFFNGTRVGVTGSDVPSHWQTARNYTIPGALVKAGRNVIAIRVSDFFGEGGLQGRSEEKFLAAGPQKIMLDGSWRFRLEFQADLKKLGPRPAPTGMVSVFFPEDRINLDYVVKYPEAIRNHPRQRGVMGRGTNLSEADLKTLHSWGANLVRAQITRNWGKINTELDLAEYNQWLEQRLKDLEGTTARAKKYGIKFVIDLHTPPGGKIDSYNMRMFFEKKYADAFLDCWRKIATRFRGNPQIYAYDLINEPVQSVPSALDYWELQRRAAEIVRAIDPDTPIMIESNESDRPQTYTYLSPLRMDNIIYQVHMYFPLEYTHQRLQGKGPLLHYPGVINGVMWNRDKIRETLQPVRDFQLRHQCKIYVGEFSAIVWAPGADRYIRDCISVFEEYGWDWTFHAFREWSGWSVEHTGTNPNDLKPSEENARKQALLEGLSRNRME